MRRRTFLMLPLLLTGCTLAGPASYRASGLLPGAPAGALVSDLAAVHAGQSHVPTMPDGDTLARWQHPVRTWVQLACAHVAREWFAPTRAARAYALFVLGMHAALVAVDAAHQQGFTISADAALATVAVQVGSYLHPLLSDVVRQHADIAQWVGVWADREDAAAVARGQRLGLRVGQQVRDWASRDHADDTAFFPDRPVTPGVWQRTPPRLWSPLDPGWGRVTPLLLKDIMTLLPPPPTWDSAVFRAEREHFREMQAHITDADRALVKHWAAGMGTMTPAGMWLEQAQLLLDRDGLTGRSATHVLAPLTAAMHDALVVGWHAKYTYTVARPITWMRETDPAWLSVIETPPFPSYPSGHSLVSSTAATVLAGYFPADAPTLQQQAADASRSRVLGGLHWTLDCEAGMRAGQQIGQHALSRMPPVSQKRG